MSLPSSRTGGVRPGPTASTIMAGRPGGTGAPASPNSANEGMRPTPTTGGSQRPH